MTGCWVPARSASSFWVSPAFLRHLRISRAAWAHTRSSASIYWYPSSPASRLFRIANASVVTLLIDCSFVAVLLWVGSEQTPAARGKPMRFPSHCHEDAPAASGPGRPPRAWLAPLSVGRVGGPLPFTVGRGPEGQPSALRTRTAQVLNSGILETGSNARMVSRLADCSSAQW